MEIRATIDSQRVQEALLRAPVVMRRHLSRALDTAAMRMVRAEQDELRTNDSIVFSTLVQSIQPQKLADLVREVAPGVRYGQPVEEGCGAHWAPIRPLKEWARVKLGDERLGYALQKTIAKRGTQPHPFVAPAFRKTESKLVQILDDGVARGLRAVFGA